MQTTQLDNGIFNNYATEPKMYYSEYPSPEQQDSYRIQGAIATLFVSVLVFASIAVTALS